MHNPLVDNRLSELLNLSQILQLTGCFVPTQYSVNQACLTTLRCRVGRSQGCLTNHLLRWTHGKSTYHGRLHEHSHVNATSGNSIGSEPPETYDSTSTWKSILSSFNAFYRFSRPHTVIGTVKS